MRPRIPGGMGRIVAVLIVVVAGAALLVSSEKPVFTPNDKAFYADPKTVDFVRPGLVMTITGAEIAADGTIKARVKLTDPKGLPLDRDGITTPGTVSTSWIAAYIPADGKQYTAYTTRVQTSPITNVSATQAGTDSGGTYKKIADGEYEYTFKTKVPASADKTATHTIGVYGSRNLSEFGLGTNYGGNTYNFIPGGGDVKKVRDVVRTESCNKCHDFDKVGLHGGSRQTMELCVLCHQPQTVDPDTGNSVDMPVMAHKIHMGKYLPSVVAGTPYKIIGNSQSVHDYSTVTFPTLNQETPSPVHCEACHEIGNEKATQKDAYLTPNRAACGACHDDVNFATGQNHANLPQVSDNQCSQCHQVEGELEFDISIKGAHAVPELSKTRAGINFAIQSVTGKAGEKPTVVYSVKDDKGNPYAMSSFVAVAGQSQRLALILAGPAWDYGYTKLGAAPNGYVSEDPTKKANCAADGNCTYQFTAAIPADAKGTYSVGIEGRLGIVINQGTNAQKTGEYGGANVVKNFSVDGSEVGGRRQVVDLTLCNKCHGDLRLHGQNRNRIEQCVLCHNPSETDTSRRPATDQPAQTVNFAYMVHRLHAGEQAEPNTEYTIYGFGGSKNDFTEVRYPALLNTCTNCHANGGQNVDGKADLNQVTTPRQYLNPSGPITAACGGCHTSKSAWSHMLSNTTKLGESCEACHGSAGDFSVDKVHAQ